MDLFIQSKVSAGIICVESDAPLAAPSIVDNSGKSVSQLLYTQNKDGRIVTVFDASQLECWSPEHPVLYTLKCQDVSQRFGYCEIATLDNRAVMLNGTPCFLRGYIRGIVAHEHPNMTGKSLKEAAVKNIRQAKKYGFNLVRFHSRIPAPEFVEAADEEGLLIHMEIGFAYEFDAAGNKKNLAMSNEQWEDLRGVCLDGTVYCCRAFLPDMVRRQSGCIINISSVWGVKGASFEAAYSAVKAGIIGLTLALSKEYAPSSIRVNCIAPGVIDTDMSRCYDLDMLAKETPLCRVGQPEEIAQAALFLSEAGFVTGQVLGVDGGFGM